jgi:hypothetical protein
MRQMSFLTLSIKLETSGRVRLTGGLNVPPTNHRWWMKIEVESMTTTKCVVQSFSNEKGCLHIGLLRLRICIDGMKRT